MALDNIYIGIIIVILIVLFYCFYISWKHDVDILEKYEQKIKLIKSGMINDKTAKYQSFMNELKEDMHKYNISPSDQLAMQKLMHKIMFVEITGKKSVFKKILNSSLYGMLQGAIVGFITGGISGSLAGALIFGTVGPIIKTHQELNPCDESLINSTITNKD